MSKFLGVEPVCVRTHRQAFRLVNSIDISTIFDGAKAPTPYSRSACEDLTSSCGLIVLDRERNINIIISKVLKMEVCL